MALPAQRIYTATVTIPAGTTPDVLFTQDVSFSAASVVGIRWRVPPGPSGLMGFAVTSDGGWVIPAQSGTFIIADNESGTWDMTGYQDSGSWQVTGYNNDGYDHTVYLQFLTVEPGGDTAQQANAPVTPAFTSNADLSPPPPDVSTFVAGLEVQS